MEVKKSSFPYLVDIGITKKCYKNCPFCYANASIDGKHASVYDIEATARVLQESGVFEVVIGGYGEPTLFDTGYYSEGLPGVWEAAKPFFNNLFKVGLTTANFQWPKQKFFSRTMQYLDSVAISCNSLKDVPRAIALIDATRKVNIGDGEDRSEIRELREHYTVATYVQTIIGLMPWEKTIAILKALHDSQKCSRITLLGFRNHGRGTKVKSHPVPESWYDELRQKFPRFNIGIDMSMAKQWHEKLITAGVKDYALCGSEGKQTCYLDLVDMVLMPHSYSDKRISLRKNFTAENFLKAFSSF